VAGFVLCGLLDEGCDHACCLMHGRAPFRDAG
jgi:hypothetical protein